jgi:hypothetical protein
MTRAAFPKIVQLKTATSAIHSLKNTAKRDLFFYFSNF